MVPLFSIVALGFLLGMRHATDPDHVVAVATIVSRERTLRAAAPIGIVWGFGHTATILVVGLAIILFGVVIPPRLGLGMEFSVSLMLVLLGGWNLALLFRRAPAHDQDSHHHPHRGVDRLDRLAGGLRGYRFVRPLVVGVVHGLAGSAAIALLVLGTISDARWGIVYLAVFGGGTIAGMLLVTTALALPIAFSAARFERLHRFFGFGSAAISVGFGAILAYQIGVVQGLFSANPQWTPG